MEADLLMAAWLDVVQSGEVKKSDIILKVDGEVDVPCHALFELTTFAMLATRASLLID